MICRDAIAEVFENEGGTLSTSEVTEWIYAKYPDRPWQESTIRTTLIGLSVNHPTSRHYPSVRRHAFLFRVHEGQYRIWDADKDGSWIVTENGVERVDDAENSKGIEESVEAISRQDEIDSHTHSILIRLWGTQNSILQSARGIFLAVESILISFAVSVLSSGSNAGIALVLVIPGIVLNILWYVLVQDRGYNDSYLRWQILRLENGERVSREVLTEFRDWQQKKTAEKRKTLISDDLGKGLVQSPMRRALDTVLPSVFMLLWILVILIVLTLFLVYAFERMRVFGQNWIQLRF